VTLKTPPKGEHFHAFHGPAALASANHTEQPMTPQTAMHGTGYPYGYGWGQPYGMMPHPMLPAPIAPVRSLSLGPSSDPPDFAAKNPYPLISDFIATLQLQHPHRNLFGTSAAFAVNDYFNIDEVISFSKEELMGTGFEMSGGSAKFLLTQVDNEMRRVERAMGVKRRRTQGARA
jgi:hypothetical protein